MVAAIRRGESLRTVATTIGVSPPAVQRWVERAQGKRLERVDFSDQPSVPHQVANRTSTEIERQVLGIRRELKEVSALGEFGAAAIRRELAVRNVQPLPGVRTIGYLLERRGLLDGRTRQRRNSPPPGWYLPAVAAGRAELDEFDFVEGLIIKGGPEIKVLKVVSLQGGLVDSWVTTGCTAELTRGAIIEHWRGWGLPAYAQFDNDTRFQGPHTHPDTMGTVIKLCVSLQVVPVLVPPREHGMQNAIEGFNERWQAKVWSRVHYPDLPAVQAQSARYSTAYRQRQAARMELPPGRRAFPPRWQFDPQAKVGGQMIFLRRTTEQGAVSLLGHQVVVARHWVHRLVKCVVDIDAKVMRFSSLRCREPQQQSLLHEVAYTLLPWRCLHLPC
jgi:hypothetical protein